MFPLLCVLILKAAFAIITADWSTDELCNYRCRNFDSLATDCIEEKTCFLISDFYDLQACLKSCQAVSDPCHDTCEEIVEMCAAGCPDISPDPFCFDSCMSTELPKAILMVYTKYLNDLQEDTSP